MTALITETFVAGRLMRRPLSWQQRLWRYFEIAGPVGALILISSLILAAYLCLGGWGVVNNLRFAALWGACLAAFALARRQVPPVFRLVTTAAWMIALAWFVTKDFPHFAQVSSVRGELAYWQDRLQRDGSNARVALRFAQKNYEYINLLNSLGEVELAWNAQCRLIDHYPQSYPLRERLLGMYLEANRKDLAQAMILAGDHHQPDTWFTAMKLIDRQLHWQRQYSDLRLRVGRTERARLVDLLMSKQLPTGSPGSDAIKQALHQQVTWRILAVQDPDSPEWSRRFRQELDRAEVLGRFAWEDLAASSQPETSDSDSDALVFSTNPSWVVRPGAWGERIVLSGADGIPAAGRAWCVLEWHQEARQELRFLVGSDDGVQVWRNGRSILTHRVKRDYDLRQDWFELKLTPGPQQLVVAVDQLGGNWSVGAAWVGLDGWPALL